MLLGAKGGNLRGLGADGDGEGDEDDDGPSAAMQAAAEAAAAAKARDDGTDPNVLRVVGNLVTFVVRLEEEFTKSLQRINPHTQEYILRLRDEASLVALASLARECYVRIADARSASTVALLQIEHMYYKHDSIAHTFFKAQIFAERWGAFGDLHPACLSPECEASASVDVEKTHPAAACGKPSVDDGLEYPDISAEIRALCEFIYRHGDDRCRTRAMLCHITHLSLHDRFYEGRDLLLMSHLQESVYNTDVATQILFNRMMVTLGLCAFRKGMVPEAHGCLAEVMNAPTHGMVEWNGTEWNRMDHYHDGGLVDVTHQHHAIGWNRMDRQPTLRRRPHLPVPAPAPARLSFAWRRPEVQLNDERYI